MGTEVNTPSSDKDHESKKRAALVLRAQGTTCAEIESLMHLEPGAAKALIDEKLKEVIQMDDSDSAKDFLKENLQRAQKSAQGKTVVFVLVENDQSEERQNEVHIATRQMGQQYWALLLNEVENLLDSYEITGNQLTGITVWHSPPDANTQSACWSLTVQESRVESLRDRMHSLVTKRPYKLVNGAGVLSVKVV